MRSRSSSSSCLCRSRCPLRRWSTRVTPQRRSMRQWLSGTSPSAIRARSTFATCRPSRRPPPPTRQQVRRSWRCSTFIKKRSAMSCKALPTVRSTSPWSTKSSQRLPQAELWWGGSRWASWLRFSPQHAPGGDGPMREAGQPGVVRSGSLSVFELMVGDCLADPSEVAIPARWTRRCGAVFSTAPSRSVCGRCRRNRRWSVPRRERLDGASRCGLSREFPGYTSVEYFASQALYFTYIYPTLDSWSANDDRDIVCVVGSAQTLNGSVKGAGDALPLVDPGS